MRARITHELCHALGYRGHSGDPASVMYYAENVLAPYANDDVMNFINQLY